MSTSGFLSSIGVKRPIFQGPMGGGPSTPELVAAVSEAGGMGWLAGAYLTAEELCDQAARVRALTDRPFGVNLFAGAWSRQRPVVAEDMCEVMARAHQALGIEAPSFPDVPMDPFPGQLEAVLDIAPAMFSFTFGMPRGEHLDRLRSCGIRIAGTATSLREARLLRSLGVDAIFAQGEEAGGHRGTFAGAFETAMSPTFELVRAIADDDGSTPVIAAGGLMDGRDIARALERGAVAAALGTAFLATPESGAPEAYKQAVLSARPGQTRIIDAFSGRPARGLPNAFVRDTAGAHVAPYPLQNMLTRPMRAAAARQNQADYLSLWAGSGAHRARTLPAGALVDELIREIEAAQADGVSGGAASPQQCPPPELRP